MTERDKDPQEAPSAWKRFWLGQDKEGNVVAGEPIELPTEAPDPMPAPVDIVAQTVTPVTTGTVEANLNWPESIVSAIKHSFDWKGRASRPAYWWMFLTYLIILYGPLLLAPVVPEDGSDLSALGYLLILVWAAFIPPVISVTVRRLHDSGRSGWWWWISLIPIVGSLVLLVLMLLEGDKEANQYGLPPQGGTSSPE